MCRSQTIRKLKTVKAHQAMKQMIEATRRMGPNPPSTYLTIFLNRFLGGGLIWFKPCSLSLRCT